LISLVSFHCKHWLNHATNVLLIAQLMILLETVTETVIVQFCDVPTLTGLFKCDLKCASLSETTAVFVSLPVILPSLSPLPVKSLFIWTVSVSLLNELLQVGGNKNISRIVKQCIIFI